MSQINEIDKSLDSLLKSLANDSSGLIYSNYRVLYKIGSDAIPSIEHRIMRYQWDVNVTGIQLRMLSGLLSLVNDINEDDATRIGNAIKDRGCVGVVEERINSITSFTLSAYTAYIIQTLTIYVSRDISQHERIINYIDNWLSIVPREDLRDLDRIYIVPNSNEDHLGTYMPILSSIMIEWRNYVKYSNPLSKLFLIDVEKTLYHEIGHHSLKHTFGNDPGQENEANDYARKLLHKNHPRLRSIVAGIKRIIGFKSSTNDV